MSFTTDVLLVILIAVFVSANDIDLATNTYYLLLLLLILSLIPSTSGCTSCALSGTSTTCSGRFI